jgi:hypothetical protein
MLWQPPIWRETTLKRHLAALTLCLSLLITATPIPASGGTAVLLEPAKTRVGLARVKLRVAELRLTDVETLSGTYEIKVPLAPWRNDRGEITLHAPESLERLTVEGGQMRGKGYSELDGRTHEIVCEFGREGAVRILVSTPDGELDFRTRFELVEESNEFTR